MFPAPSPLPSKNRLQTCHRAYLGHGIEGHIRDLHDAFENFLEMKATQDSI